MFKKHLFIFLVLIGISSSFFQNLQAAENDAIQTVTLAVENMTCRMCPITVRKSLGNIDGVIEARSDFDTKTAMVKFDRNKTNIKALIAATTNAGYPSSIK